MLRTKLFYILCLFAIATSITIFLPGSSGSALLRRVTSTDEEIVNLNPALSGDGRFVAFESTADLAGVDGGRALRAIRAELAVNPTAFVQMGISRAVAPAISQDASHVAFASHEDPLGLNPDRNSEIFLFDGSTLKQITNTKPGEASTRTRDGNFQPSITDDGSLIAFASNRNLTERNADQNFEIVVYDRVTGSFGQLT
ncbi:MAG: TolB family protein, partial [Pyrinomonadaceae bacterium]